MAAPGSDLAEVVLPLVLATEGDRQTEGWGTWEDDVEDIVEVQVGVGTTLKAVVRCATLVTVFGNDVWRLRTAEPWTRHSSLLSSLSHRQWGVLPNGRRLPDCVSYCCVRNRRDTTVPVWLLMNGCFKNLITSIIHRHKQMRRVHI